MNSKSKTVFLSGVLVLAVGTQAMAQRATIKPQDNENPLPELVSGYYFSNPRTRAMQDDDFDNPAFLWLETGAQLWNKKEGRAGKACATCHKQASQSMKGVGARYPTYHKDSKKVINLEQRINLCRRKHLQAPLWKWESNELLAMTVYVKNQSRGLPVKINPKGANAPFYAKGKEFYYSRRGQLNLSCAHCHEGNYGNKIRADLLSQGQSNGFPAYRLKWQRVGSLHRRFRGCNKQVRAEPYKYGAEEYVNLELYLAWRGNGLPVETPAIRR